MALQSVDRISWTNWVANRTEGHGDDDERRIAELATLHSLNCDDIANSAFGILEQISPSISETAEALANYILESDHSTQFERIGSEIDQWFESRTQSQ